MKTYEEIYKTYGLSYFDSYIQNTITALDEGKCVCFSSMYQSGGRRLLDYLSYTLALHENYEIYYESSDIFTIETLEHIQKLESDKKIIFISPFFEHKDKAFKQFFLKLFSGKKNKFLSILWLPSEFLENPESYFGDDTTLYEALFSLTPLSQEKAIKAIMVRQQMDDRYVSSSEISAIVKLSGGHIGLMKYMRNMCLQGWHLSYNALISEPAIRTILIRLKHELQTLSPEILQRIGLITRNGIIQIPLLKLYVTRSSFEIDRNLTPSQRQLLFAFLNNNGKPLSLESIFSVLNTNQSYSTWAIYKQISRFAQAVAAKYLVRNIKGKGYLLINKQ